MNRIIRIGRPPFARRKAPRTSVKPIFWHSNQDAIFLAVILQPEDTSKIARSDPLRGYHSPVGKARPGQFSPGKPLFQLSQLLGFLPERPVVHASRATLADFIEKNRISLGCRNLFRDQLSAITQLMTAGTLPRGFESHHCGSSPTTRAEKVMPIRVEWVGGMHNRKPFFSAKNPAVLTAKLIRHQDPLVLNGGQGALSNHTATLVPELTNRSFPNMRRLRLNQIDPEHPFEMPRFPPFIRQSFRHLFFIDRNRPFFHDDLGFYPNS